MVLVIKVDKRWAHGWASYVIELYSLQLSFLTSGGMNLIFLLYSFGFPAG